LSTAAWEWPGWVCEPLWHDTLAVAVAKRSHLLSYREVPRQELLKQPLICAQSTADEPWRAVAHGLVEDAPQGHEQTVSTFDMAMTLVSAGYGIAVAPAARLTCYLRRGIAARWPAPTAARCRVECPWATGASCACPPGAASRPRAG